jgi:two-component sensor histidine kinase
MTRVEFEDVFHVLPSPYMVLDRELRYVATNIAYCDTVDRTSDELYGKKLFDMFPSVDANGQRLRLSLERVLETGKPDTLAFISYSIPVATAKGGGFEERFWTAIHVPILDEEGDVAFIVQKTTDVTDLHRLREASFFPFRSAGATDLLKRAQEAEKAHKALSEENSDFRRLFKQAPGLIAVMTGPNHVFSFVNDAYSEFVGGRDVVGMTVREALPDLESQGFFEMLDTVFATGKPKMESGARVMLTNIAGGAPVEAYLDFSFQPLFDSDGKPSGIFVQATDRTVHVKAEEARELLVRELNHRVKNLFAVAMSMVNMTARHVQSPEQMASVLTGRLNALSQAHSLAMSERPDLGDKRILLSDLIDKILAPHVVEGVPEGSSSLRRAGPDVWLGNKAATSMALVLHELSTNAAKYGAVSVAGGNLAIEWSVQDSHLALHWLEHGGPSLEGPPAKNGFGTRLARISVEGQLGGKIDVQWLPTGVSISITAPMDRLAS